MPDNKSDHDLLIEMHTDLRDLVKVVKGNGQAGLSQRTSALETAVQSIRSNMTLLAWIVGLAVSSGLLKAWIDLHK